MNFGSVLMLRFGKVGRDVLEEIVYKRLGRKRRDVVLGPAFGEDAGIVKIGSKHIVIACDPITGAVEKIGWLSVYINANDVAVCGGEPRWFSPIILLPERYNETHLEKIMDDMHKACLKLKVSIVTGHTEVTPGISHPIVAGQMAGPLVSMRPIKSGGGRVGDLIVMSKTAGIEGTAILATDFRDKIKDKIPLEVLDKAARYYEMVSVVEEAMSLAKRNIPTAMHDPTEGGVLGGVYEIAEASRTSFIVYEEKIPVAKETEIICNTLKCDPLKLISSGVLLATVPRENIKRLTKLEFKIIGELRKKKYSNILIRKDGSEEVVGEMVQDELWRLLTELR
ncbi:MAG: AIR synthase family protein [Nitrososphaerota archaeon]